MIPDIVRPYPSDSDACHHLFREAIRHAATGDSIDPDRTDWVAEEIDRADRLLREDFASDGENAFFLIARSDERVIGSVARIVPGEVIRSSLAISPDRTPEVGCLFVLPEYHRRGIASLLFSAILDRFRLEGWDEYVLDCGYRSSQGFWRKKLGEPDLLLKDHWGVGYDHVIWRKSPV